MAKSRSRRPSRSKAASKRKTRRPSAPRRKPGVIRLKPLYAQIGRVLKQLEQLQKRPAAPGVAAELAPVGTDSVSLAIARLTQHQRDFEDICGPTMEIPAP